jgi:hypothetical protein
MNALTKHKRDLWDQEWSKRVAYKVSLHAMLGQAFKDAYAAWRRAGGGKNGKLATYDDATYAELNRLGAITRAADRAFEKWISATAGEAMRPVP